MYSQDSNDVDRAAQRAQERKDLEAAIRRSLDESSPGGSVDTDEEVSDVTRDFPGSSQEVHGENMPASPLSSPISRIIALPSRPVCPPFTSSAAQNKFLGHLLDEHALHSAVHFGLQGCIIQHTEFIARKANLMVVRKPGYSLYTTLLDNAACSISHNGMQLEADMTGRLSLSVFVPNSIHLTNAPLICPCPEEPSPLQKCHYFRILDVNKILCIYNHIAPSYLKGNSLPQLHANLTPILGRYRQMSEVNLTLSTGQIMKLFQVSEKVFSPGGSGFPLSMTNWDAKMGHSAMSSKYSVLKTESHDPSRSFCKLLAGLVHGIGMSLLLNCNISIIANYDERYADKFVEVLYDSSIEPFLDNFCCITSPENRYVIRQTNVLKVRCCCASDNLINFLYVDQSIPKYQATERVCQKEACLERAKRQQKMISHVLAEPRNVPRPDHENDGSLGQFVEPSFTI